MMLKGVRKNMLPVTKRTAAPVRLNSPMAAAAAADVQGAVVEKGIEVMGQMVDKQLKIIDEAQEKAENFLKKEVRLHTTVLSDGLLVLSSTILIPWF